MGELWLIVLSIAAIAYFVREGGRQMKKSSNVDHLTSAPPPPTAAPEAIREVPPQPPLIYGMPVEDFAQNPKIRPNGEPAVPGGVNRGYQPTDRCSCGGTWVKRVNSESGGQFFSCSKFPRCKKTRDQVLRERLGSRYSLFYCSHGHDKAHFGVVLDPRTGREVCRRCISKGYLNAPKEKKSPPPKLSETDRRSEAIFPTKKSGRSDVDGYCRNGHLRTTENTYVRPDGSIECRICRKNARK